jgi:HSP20 family protein
MFDMIPWRRRDLGTSPERSAVDLRREMDNIFERFFGETAWPLPGLSRSFSPAFDLSENDDEFVVKAELPGVDPKEVDINLTGNLLTIKGEKRGENEERNGNYHRIERTYGSFSRSFQLPCEIRKDEVTATYKDGVLDLRLPKAEEAKRKTLKIEVKTE